jgi:hypothetical protein
MSFCNRQKFNVFYCINVSRVFCFNIFVIYIVYKEIFKNRILVDHYEITNPTLNEKILGKLNSYYELV